MNGAVVDRATAHRFGFERVRTTPRGSEMIDRPTRRMLIEDRQAAELCRKRVTSLTNIVIAIVSFVAVEPALSFSMGVSWVLAVVAIVVMRWV